MNCSPRFLRMSTYALPATSDMAKLVKIPLGCVASPLGVMLNGEPGTKINPNENERHFWIDLNAALPVVELTAPEGPVRCTRCRCVCVFSMCYIDSWTYSL